MSKFKINNKQKIYQDGARTENQLRASNELDQSKKAVHQIKNDKIRLEQYQQSKSQNINFFKDFYNIYRFNGTKNKVIIILGIIIALISGVNFPLFIYFWGKWMDHTINDAGNLANTLDQSLKYYMALMGLAICSILMNTIVFSIWKFVSQTTSKQFRMNYLQNFIKRNMKWIQRQNLYQISAQFRQKCLIIQKAIGTKVALFYNIIGLIISGLITAISIRWTFALFLLALIPFAMLLVGYFIYTFITRKLQTKIINSKAEAHSVQTVALIKTVKILGIQKYQQNVYDSHLDECSQKMSKYPFKIALSTGLFYFVQFFMSGAGFLFGIQCIRGSSACPISVTGSHYTLGETHVVFFETFLCSFYILQLAANYDDIRNAILASKDIFKFMQNTQDQQKRYSIGSHLQPQSIGQIQFKNVKFAYPSNLQKNILKDVSINFLKYQFNAIIGVTGSGKSTITQLIMKLYQISSGQIIIGGQSLDQINQKWLRQRIGFVGQEPILFSGSLRQNIAVGKQNASDQEIWEVLRKVNLYEYVQRLPGQLDYNVGFGGSRLSGGQKQRVAIARAIIKRPQLLILDEATSALDRRSQKIIQKTLQNLFLDKSLKMTVICIAHKLKTIRKADKIWYLQNGLVKQEGKFQQLKCFKDLQLIQEEQILSELQIQYEFKTLKQIQKQQIQDNKMNNQAQIIQYNKSIYIRLFSYTQNQILYFFGLIASLINGISHPGSMLIVAYGYSHQIRMVTLGKLFNWCNQAANPFCQKMIDDQLTLAMQYLYGMIGFSFFIFFPYFFQFYVMEKIEFEIQNKIRKQVYHKLLRMPAKWYQKGQNQGGQIASRYALDVKLVSGLISVYLPFLVMNFTTLIAGIVLVLIYLWQIGLLSLFSIPLIAVGGFISMLFIGGKSDQALHKYQQSDKVINQLIVGIKTVLCLNYQNRFLKKYEEMIKENPMQMLKRGAVIGLFFGFSLFIIQAAIGSSLYAQDNILASLRDFKMENLVVSLIVPVWCGWIAGNNFYFIAESSSGKQSAKTIFSFLQQKTEVQVQSQNKLNNSVIIPKQVQGRFVLKNVSFKYNQDDQKYILKNINMIIEPGQKVAFVGSSGCGKSTLMLLLQRFYDFQGEITLDGVNIYDYDLEYYRSLFAVLNQQPNLFTGSVKDNIAFKDLKKQQIYNACKISFTYDMNKLWKGQISLNQAIQQFLERDVGPKGSKLSGGEKQRVACARAVLRNPKIFLMDEGTSALDRQTEKKFQKNLDQKFKGITTINIAHRMQTIENCDMIFMLQDGKIVQKGRYDEMMKRNSHFRKFVDGNKNKTINQVAQKILNRLIIKLLGLKKL